MIGENHAKYLMVLNNLPEIEYEQNAHSSYRSSLGHQGGNQLGKTLEIHKTERRKMRRGLWRVPAIVIDNS